MNLGLYALMAGFLLPPTLMFRLTGERDYILRILGVLATCLVLAWAAAVHR